MKPRTAQILRLVSSILILVYVAIPLGMAGYAWIDWSKGDLITVADGRALAAKRYPTGTYVKFPISREQISAVHHYIKKAGYVLLLRDAGNIIIFCKKTSYLKLKESGGMQIDGRIVPGLEGDYRSNLLAFVPNVQSTDAVIIAHGTTRKRQMQIAWSIFAGAFVALSISLILFRAFLENRKKQKDKPGFFEGLALNYPRLFERLGKISLNGTGLSILDYHDKRPDGSYLVTKWLTVFYMPIAPIFRERIIPAKTISKIRIPFYWHTDTLEYQKLERLNVDKRRTARIYLYHYLFFLPFSVGPLLGFLIWQGISSMQMTAIQFWCIVILLALWGMFIFYLEEKTMKTPRN